jgi:trypsin
MSVFLILLLATTTTVVTAAYDGSFTTVYTANETEEANFAAALTKSGVIAVHNNYTVDPAIVGGQVAGTDEFAWFGRLDITVRYSGGGTRRGSCGASLIYSDIAVSAAHCVADEIRSGASVAVKFNLGANQYSGSDGVVLRVERISYPNTFSFPVDDIVFYKLSNSANVTPVAWNTNSSIPQVGDLGKAIGFGLTSDDGDESPVLLKVDFPVISNADCDAFYKEDGGVSDAFTCAYAVNISKGTCNGDSGGPIITQDGMLYGITSFGNRICATAPAGFTRTSFYSELISAVRVPPPEKIMFLPWILPTTKLFHSLSLQRICALSESPPATCSRDNGNDTIGCGLFGLSIFCPLQFGGILGRLLRRLFGF